MNLNDQRLVNGEWVIFVKVDHTSFAPSSDSCILSLLTTGSNIKCRHEVPWAITSARSTRLGADYSYEDSGSCVSGEEEGGIV